MIVRSKRKRKFPDKEKLRKIKNIAVIVGIVVLLVASVIYEYANKKVYETITEVKYSYHFPDVGQGDCTIIKSENDCVVIDSGPYKHRFKCGNYVASLTDEVQLLIFTHPHSDHIGGFEELLDRVKIHNIMIPRTEETNSQFDRYLEMIDEAGINLIYANVGSSYTTGDIELQILAPIDNLEVKDGNDSSLVVNVITEDVSVLVTGDIDSSIENTLMLRYDDEVLKSDILKIPHHGSSNSSSVDFLKAVSPTYAVISCDKINPYGHPGWKTQERLEELNIPYYATADHGTIVFVSDGKNIEKH